EAGYEFQHLSAVFSGVADLKKAFEAARMRRTAGQSTLLFVDEIHRFNRAQQDGFLPFVEEGIVTLVGATTENPSFELNGALLSRTQVFVLKRLDDAALETLLQKAEAFEGRALPLTAEARQAMIAPAGGEDPLYLARRLVRMAVEDIGEADPLSLLLTTAAKDAYDFLGSPEGELALAQAVVHMATAPKSNAVYTAYGAALRMARETGSL